MGLPLFVHAAASPAARRGCKWAVAALLLLVLLPVIALVAVIVPAAHFASTADCTDFVGSDGDPVGVQEGALGGIAGTGITRAELRRVRADRAPRVTSGAYRTTSYGPPWGGIQGTGTATAGGLTLNGGAPRKYFVAVDPALVSYGSWLYIWPNPFRWRGAFLAADTGGAIRGRRIDFYDWRGRRHQNAWGTRAANVSTRPNAQAETLPILTDLAPVSPPSAEMGTTPPSYEAEASCGRAVVGGSGPGHEAIAIAVQFIGQNARTTSFARFAPPRTSLAWCAWFATNVWNLAGVPIPVHFYSGYPHEWARRGHPDLLIKAAGQRARTLALPVGTALMYGSGPNASDHINLVRARNRDGTIQVIGGNQGNSRVTTYGPCRLLNGTFVRLTGPGCDTRPIYGIVAPGGSGQDV